MKLQRYLLAELLAAFALIALIVTSVVFTALLLQFLRKAPELSVLVVLRAAPYIVPMSFPITLPLSFLIACLLTYGRFHDDNEFLAFQMGGIHPWHAVAPAVATSAVLAVGTVLLNADVIPFARLAQAEITRGGVEQLLRTIEDEGRDQIRAGPLQMSWRGRGPRGLENVLITVTMTRNVEGQDPARRTQTIQADRARVSLVGNRVVLDLDGVETRVGEGERQDTVRQANQVVAIDLEELAGKPPSQESKGSDELTAAQLHYRARTMRRLADDPGAKKELELQRKYEIEYWRRISMGLAPLAFSFVGVGLGLTGGKGSRTAAFVTAILVALPVYYPMVLGGAALAREGILPAGVSMNLGNAALVAFGAWRLRRVAG